jgi:hypothetical protein
MALSLSIPHHSFSFLFRLHHQRQPAAVDEFRMNNQNNKNFNELRMVIGKK